jgi:hypothetical protein
LDIANFVIGDISEALAAVVVVVVVVAVVVDD